MKNQFGSLLSTETEIVWLYDPANFPYVREALALTSRSKGAISNGDSDRVFVAYAETTRNVSRARRFFYVMRHDFDPKNFYVPCEGVDPLTVAPTIAGEETKRCRHITREQRACISAVFTEIDRKANEQRAKAQQQVKRKAGSADFPRKTVKTRRQRRGMGA